MAIVATPIGPLIGPERLCTHRELGGGVLLWDCSRARPELWKLIFDGFQGTLPRIEGINFHVQRTQFKLIVLEIFGGTVECLYEGDVYGLIVVRQPESTITSGRAVEGRTRLPRIRGSGLCPTRGTLSGEFTVRPALTIRLI